MLLKLKENRHLVAVTDISDLLNPFKSTIRARLQCGEEEQDLETFPKEGLCFPSGEELPRCWVDEHYRDDELSQHRSIKGY